MPFDVEFTDEFGAWYELLTEAEQDSVDGMVRLLMKEGPSLARPYADTLKGSRYANMKELRVQHAGRPYRVLFVFDPRRCAVLLIGGDKTGNARWYEEMIPKAEAIYAEHLRELDREARERKAHGP